MSQDVKFDRSQAFDYDLPTQRIAQRPVNPYDAAKLLCADRKSGRLKDSTFAALPEIVAKGDLLVFNNSKVVQARLFGRIAESGQPVELLVLGEEGAQGEVLATGKPLRKMPPGTQLVFEGLLTATVLTRMSDYEIVLRFETGEEPLSVLLERCGTMPIPPYIRAGRADERDRTDYQSLFAELPGSVAAPTASLHFTPRLVDKLKAAGSQMAMLTLHLGPASFRTLWTPETPSEPSRPGTERYRYDAALVERINKGRAAGGRVIAVGTSVVRALESMARETAAADGSWIESDLFITPGFEFSVVDAIITNFHQPRTSHLLLVQAFLGKESLARAYRHALDHGYRFLSYGDGMMIG